MMEIPLINLEPYMRTVTTILLHSLWQGVFVAILATAALSLLKDSSAKIRYTVSCCAMATLIVATAVTAVVVWPDRHGPAKHVSAPAEKLAGGEGSLDQNATIGVAAPTNHVSSSNRWWEHPLFSRYLFMIWVAGVMLFSVYHLIGWRRARGFIRRGTSPAPPEWQARFEKLCDELRIRRLVSLLSSSLVKVPCVIGWIKPVILVPVSMLTSLDPFEIEMILMHELAHVRRYDILVNILQTAMETLFFFNPAIWWISRQIRIEREDCCDDTAIVKTGNRLMYARALTNLEEVRMFQTSFNSALTGSPLRRRIQRIVGATRPRFYSSTLSLSGMLLIASLIVVVFGSLGGSSQSAVQAGEKIEVMQTFDPGPGDLRGEWEIESDHDKLHIRFIRGRDSRIVFSFDRNELFDKIGDGQKPFQFVRDAGTFFLDGEFGRNDRDCWGKGEWYFQPDSEFVHFMNGYGLRVDDQEKVLATAIFDVSREYISGLEAYNYLHLDVDKLISARSQGITPEYIEEFRKAGYPDLPYDRLLSMRVQGVSPEDAREFEKLGVGHLTADQLISAKIHDITPEFVKEFREAGFRDLSYNSFVTLRSFNLDVDDFKDCYRHRFMDLSEDNMVWVCGFHITQKDIEEMRELGHTDIDSIIKQICIEKGR